MVNQMSGHLRAEDLGETTMVEQSARRMVM